MKVNAKHLIEELYSISVADLKAAEDFRSLATNTLNYKPVPSAWSILECLEHLNRYSSFYLPEIDRHIQRNTSAIAENFKSGLIGNYLVKMVVPGEKTKKMKSFNAMNPAGSTLNTEVIDDFIRNQKKLLHLLEAAKQSDLNNTGIPVTFTKLVKLKLGDTLRFMVYHNQRHIAQALRNILTTGAQAKYPVSVLNNTP